MTPNDCRWFIQTRAHRAGVAVAVVCATLTGCASMYTHDVKPAAPTLPPAAVERLQQTAAVYFSDAFRAAKPEHSLSFLGDTHTWRHALGDASVETFRQALAAVYTNVIELQEAPDTTAMPLGVSLVVVPQPPTVEGFVDEAAVVTTYRQEIEYPVTWRVAGAATPASTTVEGIVATGAYGVGFMSQDTVDAAMIRSAGASLIAALSKLEAVDAAVPSAQIDAAAPANANGVGILRLDAGLAHGDGIERRVVACLSHAVTPPATLAGEQPGAALRDALFPWLDPGVVPGEADGVRKLLERPGVRARLGALGLGKLVLFTARDVKAREKKHMYCAAGVNAGACFGHYELRTGYVVDITLWDVARREPLAMDHAEVLRKFGAIGVLLPIPYFSSNQAEACAQMQQYVRLALQQ